MTQYLWNELHIHFEKDDGSLPNISLIYVDSKAVASGFALLRNRAVDISKNPCFWSKVYEKECPLDSVINAAELVVSGEAEPFHVLFGGIQSNGVKIPDLGVFVFQSQLTLDYRMGDSWGPAQLTALFELLSELSALDPKSSLALEDYMLPAVARRFQETWRRYLVEHSG